MSLRFRDKDVVQDSIKCFAQVQVDDISCSSLIHQHRNPVIKGHQICQAGFALSEALFAVTNQSKDLNPSQPHMYHYPHLELRKLRKVNAYFTE